MVEYQVLISRELERSLFGGFDQKTYRRTMTEKEVQKKALKHLWNLGVFAWRNNTGVLPVRSDSKVRYVSFGSTGSPDILAITSGLFVGFECKRTKGKLSEHQLSFKQNVEDAGGHYVVVRSNNDIDNGLQLIQKKHDKRKENSSE